MKSSIVCGSNRYWNQLFTHSMQQLTNLLGYWHNSFFHYLLHLLRILSRSASNSPDLTLLDFVLWGYVKPKVCQGYPDSREQMKKIVKEAAKSVPQDMLQRVIGNFHRRSTRRSFRSLRVNANDFSKYTLFRHICFISLSLFVLKLLTIEIILFFLKTLYKFEFLCSE